MKAFLLMSTMMAMAAPEAHAQQDPWLGRDKVLHFAAGAALAAGGYALGTIVFDRREARIVVGLSVGLGAGAVKEIRDRGSAGTASWRDFAWTAAGATAGVTAAWLIDRRRDADDAPAAPAVRPLTPVLARTAR